MEYRIEKDSMGEIKVPADKLWGAQTQRSFENFKIGTEKIPAEMVTVFAYLKKAAALTNKELGVVDADKADAIAAACDDILAGKLDGNFPLAVWMTGSGTQFNMNVNEVVAHRAAAILKEKGKSSASIPMTTSTIPKVRTIPSRQAFTWPVSCSLNSSCSRPWMPSIRRSMTNRKPLRIS